MPQIKEDIVQVTQLVPQDRVQNRVGEQIGGVPVPQIKEDGLQLVPQERTQNRSRKLVVDVPVPHIKEKIMDGARVLPQERVQNRVTYTGNVFTMRHHRDDQACAVDTVGLNIKGLDKYIMPQSGDSLVPVSQIQEQIVQEIVCEVPKVKVVERIQEQIHVEQASVFLGSTEQSF